MSRSLLLVVLAAVVVHARGLAGDFVYDDERFVVANAALDELTVRDAFLDPATHTADWDRDVYRPLRALGHAWDLARWGRDPFGFHLHSLLAHVLAVVLSHAALRRLVPGRDGTPALGGALLLAVHPLGVEAVDWVSSRGDLYAVAAGMAALALATGPGPRRARPAVLLAAGVAGALATLGKESAAVLPAVAAAHRVLRPPGRADPPAPSTSWPGVLALAAGVGAALALRQLALGGLSPVQTPPHGGDHLVQTGWALFGLGVTLGHLLLPVGLAVEYPQDAWAAAGGPWLRLPTLLGGSAVAGAAVLLLRRRAPTPTFLLVWMLAASLPSSSLLVTLRGLVNDRMAYPLLAPAGALFGHLLPLQAGWSRRLAFGLVVVLYGGTAIARVGVFADETSLWRDVLARQPGSVRARIGLAAALAPSEPERAGTLLEGAVARARPGSKQQAVALTALGGHLLRSGEPARARPILERAVVATRAWSDTERPLREEADASLALAEAFVRLDHVGAAEALLTEAAARAVEPVPLLVRLAAVRRIAAGRGDEGAWQRAREAFEEARRIDPGHPVWRHPATISLEAALTVPP